MYDKHLDYFILVADCGSFSKASQKAFISSNALIKQINLLENDLGIKLFHRTHHGVTLTKAGKCIYHHAKNIIELSSQAIQEAKQIDENEQQIIRIGSSFLRPCKTLVELWSTLSQDHPHIQLQVVPFDDHYAHYLSTISSLGKEIDIIVGTYPSSLWNDQCQVLKIADTPIFLAISRKNPLSQKKKITFEDLYGKELMMVERGDTAYVDHIRDDIEKLHPQIKIKDVPAYDTKVFNQCDQESGIMITINAWEDLHPALKTLPCDWDYTIPYGIIYSKHPSSLVETFIHIIDKAIKKEEISK